MGNLGHNHAVGRAGGAPDWEECDSYVVR